MSKNYSYNDLLKKAHKTFPHSGMRLYLSNGGEEYKPGTEDCINFINKCEQYGFTHNDIGRMSNWKLRRLVHKHLSGKLKKANSQNKKSSFWKKLFSK